jgi:hypothetical protein
VSPPSSDLNRRPLSVGLPSGVGTPSPVSMSAYTRVGIALLIPSPTFPTVFDGSAEPVSFFQVVPPSVDFQIPLPAPPLERPHVLISICQNPA